jgi:hypothetical protein
MWRSQETLPEKAQHNPLLPTSSEEKSPPTSKILQENNFLPASPGTNIPHMQLEHRRWIAEEAAIGLDQPLRQIAVVCPFGPAAPLN